MMPNAVQVFGILVGIGLPLAALMAAAATVWRGLRVRSASLLGALAVAAGRGLPLADELDDLAGTLLPGDRRRLGKIAEALRAGEPLPAAVRAGGGLVPASSAPALAAGVATGTLPRALRDEADRLAKSHEAGGGRLWGALLHFAVVGLALAVVFAFLDYAIAPKFKRIFDDFDTETGPAFDALFRGERGGAGEGVVLPLLGAAQLFVLALPAAFVLWQRGWRVPLVWGVWARLARPRAHAGRLCRALAAAADAGRPFADVLTAYAAHAEVRPGAIRAVAADAAAGGDLWDALHRRGVVTGGEAGLLSAAEAVGNLPAVLRLVADRADADRARRWAAVGAVLQPALVLLLGAGVGFVAYALFAPLMTVLHDVGRLW